MNSDIQQQTDQIVLWLKVIAHTLENINLTTMIAATLIIAMLIVLAFKRTTPRVPKPKKTTPDQEEMLFIEQVEKMDKEHPDWLKKDATSHMAVARAFWNAGRKR